MRRQEIVVLKKTRKWVEKFFIKTQKNGVFAGGHGFDHTKRVVGMALLLSHLEKRDPFLPVLSSLIFDIGRTSEDPRAQNFRHGEVSRELSTDFIDSIKILSNEDKEIVKNAIEDHPKRNKEVRRTYVSEIVMDADRLDAFGAVGIIRSASFRWKLPIFDEKLSLSTKDAEIKTIYQDFGLRIPEFYDMLWTKSARRIAKPWFGFTKKFTKEFKKQTLFMYKAFGDLKI